MVDSFFLSRMFFFYFLDISTQITHVIIRKSAVYWLTLAVKKKTAVYETVKTSISEI